MGGGGGGGGRRGGGGGGGSLNDFKFGTSLGRFSSDGAASRAVIGLSTEDLCLTALCSLWLRSSSGDWNDKSCCCFSFSVKKILNTCHLSG